MDRQSTPPTRAVRIYALLFISVACAAIGLGVLYNMADEHRLSSASLGELAGLTGLFVLPWVTLGLHIASSGAKRWK